MATSIRRVTLALGVLALLSATPLMARGSSHAGGKSHSSSHAKSAHHKAAPKSATHTRGKTHCASCERDARNYIRRSEAAKHAFMKQTGYPKGRRGYVIDHVVPLACGGADAPSNMQWQTIAQAKAKDRVERRGC